MINLNELGFIYKTDRIWAESDMNGKGVTSEAVSDIAISDRHNEEQT